MLLDTFDSAKADRLIESFRAGGVWQTPTLGIYNIAILAEGHKLPGDAPIQYARRDRPLGGAGFPPTSRSGAAQCPDAVAWIVKRAARRAGLDARDYSGHSLRSGLATQAAMNGAGELAIMKQPGHRSLATVRKYIRDGALFRDNAATKLGL